MAKYGTFKYGRQKYIGEQFKVNWSPDDYYNYGDINRVETLTENLSNALEFFGVFLAISFVTDRNNTSFVFYDDLNRIEGVMFSAKNAICQPEAWLTPKTNWISLDAFGYTDANRLESNLQALYTVINNIKNYIQYCGAFTCGQDNQTL